MDDAFFFLGINYVFLLVQELIKEVLFSPIQIQFLSRKCLRLRITISKVS